MDNPLSPAGRHTNRPVIDYFDHNSEAYSDHRFDWYRQIRAEAGPVFWSPNYGGYWIVLGRAELVEAAKNWEIFSSRGAESAERDRLDGCPVANVKHGGLFIPSRPGSMPLLEDDAPRWTALRKALGGMFTPGAAAGWQPRMRALADACIDRRIESGSIDFATELADIVPVIFSLELVGLPSDSYAQFAHAHNRSAHVTPDDPDWPAVASAIQSERALVEACYHDLASKPRGARGQSIIAGLLDVRDDGAEISADEISSLAMLVIGAGIDTTASTICSSLAIISADAELRKRLIAKPELIGESFDEFLRVSTPTAGLCRTATQDCELGGQQIRKGDRVMLCYGAASRDPSEFPDPDRFILGRKASRHVGFGSGNHRCIGAHFAKQEFTAVVTSVLNRIPDFQVDVAGGSRYRNIGIVDGWRQLPATFTPAARLGIDPQVPNWQFT